MSTTPQITYHGPRISPELDAEIRRHLQLIYQKLGNHTQAFALLKEQIPPPQVEIVSSSTSSGGGAISSVTATFPLSSSGGTMPDISLQNEGTGIVTNVYGTDVSLFTASGGDAVNGDVIVGDAQGGIKDSGVPLSSLTAAVFSQTNFTTAAGNQTVAHSLGYSPAFAWICVQDLGIVGFQYPTSWDGTNFYIQSSASSMHGFVVAIK